MLLPLSNRRVYFFFLLYLQLACKEYEQVISTITDYVDPDSENLNPNKRKKTNKANPQVKGTEGETLSH